MATADRVLAILSLFTMEEPEWTVDGAARALQLSSSTAYQYFRSLIDAGLLASSRAGRYVLGPAVISLDRVTRRHDPLVKAARPAMVDLIAPLDGEAVALLCRSFRLQVMCVDQFSDRPTGFEISYERGRPMPLFRGAASKIILSHLPPRVLRKLWDTQAPEIARSRLGDDWDGFRKCLRSIRRAGTLVTRGEIDAGLVGISAPVFDGDNLVVGSLGIVASVDRLAVQADLETRVVANVARQAAALTEQLRR